MNLNLNEMRGIQLIIVSIVFLTSCIKYPLPDATLKPKIVCGEYPCKPGQAGKLLHFSDNPFSPDIDENSTARKIAFAVLGQNVPENDISGGDINNCSAGLSNPFTIDDVKSMKFASGRDIEYEKKEQLELNVEAATKASLDQLDRLNLSQAKINELEVKIKAAYSKISGKELSITGKYSEWGLSLDALNRLKKAPSFDDCREYMNNNNYRIITAVGLVVFEIEFQSNSIDKLANEVDAILEAEGINASLAFTFKREVTKNLKATNGEVYQIVVWRHAKLNGDRLG